MVSEGPIQFDFSIVEPTNWQFWFYTVHYSRGLISCKGVKKGKPTLNGLRLLWIMVENTRLMFVMKFVTEIDQKLEVFFLTTTGVYYG